MKHTLESLLELSNTDEGRQKIRVIVAELVGWSTWKGSENYPSLKVWTAPDGKARCRSDIPEYHTSLNAIMPEVRKLNEDQQNRWINVLADIIDPMGELGWKADFTIATAEAVHHCIAFILTKQP